MSLLIELANFSPDMLGDPQKESVRARNRLDAIVGRLTYCCRREKNKENRRRALKLLYINSVPKLKRRISYSWRLSFKSQAGDICPNACSHR